MNKELELVKDVFVKRLGIQRENIHLDSHLEDDLDADSLFLVELVLEIDRSLGVKIPDNELDELKRISDVMSVIARYSKVTETQQG